MACSSLRTTHTEPSTEKWHASPSRRRPDVDEDSSRSGVKRALEKMMNVPDAILELSRCPLHLNDQRQIAVTRLIISPRHLGENLSFTQGEYGRGTTGIGVQILHCGVCKSPFNSDIFLCHLMRDPTGGSSFKRNFQLSCPNCVRLAYYFSAWRCTQSYGISPSHRRLSARSCMYHKYKPPPFP